jgi:hypothetical protein
LEDVDLLVYPGIEFSAAWKRRQTVRIERRAIPVASVQDLIMMKHKAWTDRQRPQDLADIQALKEILRSRGGH